MGEKRAAAIITTCSIIPRVELLYVNVNSAMARAKTNATGSSMFLEYLGRGILRIVFRVK